MSKTVTASKILNLLKEEWSLNRKLINAKDKDFSGSASGTTKFLECDENTLSYDERIKVNFVNGIEVDATATYKFQIEEDKLHQYLVTPTSTEPKEDHMFELDFFTTSSQICSEASYICGSDNYSVRYSFHNNDSFRITYTVSGPNKNYSTETEFERVLPIGENLETESGSEY